MIASIKPGERTQTGNSIPQKGAEGNDARVSNDRHQTWTFTITYPVQLFFCCVSL